MISVIRRILWQFTLLVGLVACSVTSAASESSDWGLESLMAKLAQVTKAELDFTEIHTSIFLTDELITSGTMVYRAPDFISKQVDDPYKEKIRISGDQIFIEKENAKGNSQKKVYSLANYEGLSTAVESVRATLAGNLSGLIDHFDVELAGLVDSWKLTLLPKTETSKEFVEEIVVNGSAEKINQIETTEPNGDESRLILTYKVLE